MENGKKKEIYVTPRSMEAQLQFIKGIGRVKRATGQIQANETGLVCQLAQHGQGRPKSLSPC